MERLSLAGRARVFLTALPAGYWQALATTCLLYLGRFDFAFITVRASQVSGKLQKEPSSTFLAAGLQDGDQPPQRECHLSCPRSMPCHGRSWTVHSCPSSPSSPCSPSSCWWGSTCRGF